MRPPSSLLWAHNLPGTKIGKKEEGRLTGKEKIQAIDFRSIGFNSTSEVKKTLDFLRENIYNLKMDYALCVTLNA